MAGRPNIAVLALAAALAAAAGPASAQRMQSDAIGPDAGRAQALRECSAKAERLTNYVWGSQQSLVYRACMTQQGQVE